MLLLPLEVDEQAAVVLGVLVDPVVERLDLLLLKEAQHLLLELAGPLARDDLHLGRLLAYGLLDDAVQRLVDLAALVVDVVEVQLQLHASESKSPSATETRGEAGDRAPRRQGLASAVDVADEGLLFALQFLDRGLDDVADADDA